MIRDEDNTFSSLLFTVKGINRGVGFDWWRNGFVLFYKRLEKHRFIFCRKNIEENFEITQAQLHGLLAGLDFSLMRHFPEINYSQYA